MKLYVLLPAVLLLAAGIATAQNVGIGTTVPDGLLHIKGTNWIKAVLENATGEPRGYIGADNNGTVTLASNAYWNGSTWIYPSSGPSFYMLLHRGNQQYEFRVRPDGGAQATAMVIEAGGNVGIGTTSPQQLLSVNGGLVIDQGNANTGTSAGILSFGSLSGEGIGSKRNAGGNQNGLDFYTNHSARLSIGNNGNVGIGMAPSTGTTRLHLSAPAGADAISLFSNTTYSGTIRVTDSSMQIFPAYGTSICFPQPCNTVTPKNLVLIPAATGINLGGNVGVGVDKPNAKMHINGAVVIGNAAALPAPGFNLSVTGKMVCEEIKVELATGWPDYVFGSNYHRMPLDELERHININKHLPGIPSAAEITAANGFELGALNKKLLEKVEELTLYLIEANKRINTLQQQVNTLANTKH